MNPIMNTDSYKMGHFEGYVPGAAFLSSYGEARGGKFPEIVFFGAKLFTKKYLSQQITYEHIAEAKEICRLHGVPFFEAGWRRIVEEYDGYPPLHLEAVPEGTVLPASNVAFQIVNTGKDMAWLTSYFETPLLRACWYGSTVATISWRIRNVVARYLEETSDVPVADQIDFKLNDFGSRGVSSLESSEIGGLAHLLSFKGTDNLVAVMCGREFYDCEMAGFSIPAAEHSTITSWGREGEVDAYANMIDKFAPDYPLIAVVSDSYDLMTAVNNLWGEALREKVINCGSTIIVRPDSGEPVSIVTKTIQALMNKFGYTTNSKGYRVLPSYIRVIQGDGINEESIEGILRWMKANKLSAENVAFGMGGALLQGCNRDTSAWAMKASAVMVNGVWKDVFKDPITDTGKRSKRGVLALIKEDGQFKTIRDEELGARTFIQGTQMFAIPIRAVLATSIGKHIMKMMTKPDPFRALFRMDNGIEGLTVQGAVVFFNDGSTYAEKATPEITLNHGDNIQIDWKGPRPTTAKPK